MPRRVLVLAPCLFSLLSFPHPTAAAPVRAAADAAARIPVAGRVVDTTGAPLASARVFSTDASGEPGPGAVSNERGEFQLALPAGRCTITVVAEGFDPQSQSLDVAPGRRDPLVFSLDIAAVRESVTVSAPAAAYEVPAVTSATKTIAPLRDVPQSVTVVTRQLIQDQLMTSVADVVRYVPGVAAHQGENNRDQVIIRGNNSSADFFVDGVRDDVQYYRDLYNLERLEALKGPNAMIFGRGGGGGVINRVTKEASFTPIAELGMSGGSFGQKRLTGDFGGAIRNDLAVRLNAVYENSGSFRDGVERERYGINPTVTFRPASRARLSFGVEHFRDARVADRGIPSYQGRPLGIDRSAYFGDPRQSPVRARVDVASAAYEQQVGAFTIRNRTLAGGYERRYQNFVPGAVSADGSRASLSAYNNDTARTNVFNQTDAIAAFATGSIRHTVLAGVEVGRQSTDGFRNTGYFGNVATSIQVPVASPTIAPPIVFRQSATDADNHVRTAVSAIYAQDQLEVTPRLQLIAGLRADSFDLQYHNNRTGDDLGRVDHLVSPRAGVVVKPIVPLSLYGSYTVSHLPSAGDQFSSLTVITEQVKPETFRNYEVGLKWDAAPALAFTAAAYRLDRTNTRATDPNDPTRIVQTGAQRTNGFEAGLNGRVTAKWQVAGGYAWQDAFVTSATIAARAGARVAQVPRHSLSLWNVYQALPRLALAAGIVHRTDTFAAIDNTVVLPGYTVVDAAAFLTLTPRLRLQLNVENAADRVYYLNADNNTNISPGSPRAVRIGLVTKF